MPLILLVEPHEKLRTDISEMLIFENLEVISTNDANLALQMVHDHHPDMIISEMAYGDFDACNFLKAVRADSTIAATPFIFCTARIEQIDARKAMFLGADDLLPKPFTAFDLLITVMIHLHKPEIIKSIPNGEKDNDIFVNYTGTDTAMIQQGIKHLSLAGLSVVLAKSSPQIGQEDEKNTITLLQRSKCLVTFFSTEHKTGYDRKFATQFEMRVAQLIGIPVLCVHTDGDEKDISTDFKRFHIMDARENSDQIFHQLSDKVSEYVAYLNTL